ncbi:hypothetical protein MFIFM68171_09723 [Madurella fahalii]|uniref:Uncharacterized protein n=1 Tax=Madurella fahalii TaxID=1157608 RepID=A0ABQ0GP51_9PEZI
MPSQPLLLLHTIRGRDGEAARAFLQALTTSLQVANSVKSFVDDVFTATLDEALAKEATESGKKTTMVEPELMHDAGWPSGEFQREANFAASRCQVYHHTATCVKYSIKEVLKSGAEKCGAQLCRFRAPWKLVPETSFTDDGLLEVKRDHPMVNQYNQSMAIGHNTEISAVVTRKKGLALIYYLLDKAMHVQSRVSCFSNHV